MSVFPAPSVEEEDGFFYISLLTDFVLSGYSDVMNEYRRDPAAVSTDYIGEHLVAYDDGFFLPDSEFFQGFDVACLSGLVRIAHIIGIDIFDEPKDTFLVVVCEEERFQTCTVYLPEKLVYFGSGVISVVNESVVYIKYNCSDAFPGESAVIDAEHIICILIGIKFS